jgi:RimJ/RimL family protein N-acetyltransferase
VIQKPALPGAGPMRTDDGLVVESNNRPDRELIYIQGPACFSESLSHECLVNRTHLVDHRQRSTSRLLRAARQGRGAKRQESGRTTDIVSSASRERLDVELQRFEREDCARLLVWVSSRDELIEWAGSSFVWPLDGQQLDDYVASASNDHLIFKAVARGATHVVGHIDLIVNRDHRWAHITRVLVAPPFRGRGICTTMMREIVRLAFDQLKLHRLSLSVFDFNTPAISCYESVGFVKEGHARDSARAGGGYWSSFSMALLATDVNAGRGSTESE